MHWIKLIFHTLPTPVPAESTPHLSGRMNLCKSGLISARTKSLREKFSRNRSYSELSFKDSNTTSSLVSTPTESCSGSLAERSNSQTNFAFCKKTSAPSGPSSISDVHRQRTADSYYNADPYCSALDLSGVGASGFDEPRFPWQRDVAIQCDLISAPISSHCPPKKCPSYAGTGFPSGKEHKEQQAKKKTSSSSTSSAASTLINAAAATLRMTGIGSGNSNNNYETSGGNHSNSRFWKSSLLLPSLNVSSVAENAQMLEGNNFESTETDSALRRQKSSRWASASVVRRPVLKRAASFDSRGGYARLVQSTSSPSSPPENVLDFEAPLSALPVLTTTHEDRGEGGAGGAYGNCGIANRGQLSVEYQHQSHSASQLTGGGSSGGSSNNTRGNFFFSSNHSLSNAFRPTALLGASAAMTAAAPFTASLNLSAKTTSESNTFRAQAPSNHPHQPYQHQYYHPQAQSTVSTSSNTNNNSNSGSGSGRRKLSSNEISLKELRRKQFMTTRKQPSSAPDSFDDDSPFSVCHAIMTSINYFLN